MGAIVIETPIARRADDVFAYLRDHSHQQEWQAGHVLAVVVEPPGPAQVGTKVHKVRRTPLGEVRFTEEVTELDESGRRWTEVTTTGALTGTTLVWQVLVDGTGAVLRFSADMHAKGLMRVLLPLVRRAAVKDWKTEQASLKVLLESGSAG